MITINHKEYISVLSSKNTKIILKSDFNSMIKLIDTLHLNTISSFKMYK